MYAQSEWFNQIKVRTSRVLCWILCTRNHSWITLTMLCEHCECITNCELLFLLSLLNRIPMLCSMDLPLCLSRLFVATWIFTFLFRFNFFLCICLTFNLVSMNVYVPTCCVAEFRCKTDVPKRSEWVAKSHKCEYYFIVASLVVICPCEYIAKSNI